MMKKEILSVSAPGRLCLFGEHQDYFGLPVLAAAIDLRIRVTGQRCPDKKLVLDLPDIGGRHDWPLGWNLDYSHKRDYLKSAVNILARKKIQLKSGWECRISGEIPINSGTASSSALQVAWVTFLLTAAGNPLADNPDAAAELAFESEVAEFNEPGGKMDHYTSALGGVVSIHFSKKLRARTLSPNLEEFVLADSMVRKNTTGTLGFIKSHVLSAVKKIRRKNPGFSLEESAIQEVEAAEKELLPVEKRLLTGTLMTRDITAEGEGLLQAEKMDHDYFGDLLCRQQKILRDYLRISSPRINKMVETALEAGALGAKINGSGEGGCIFAYCPGRAPEVARELENLNSRVYTVRVDQGVRWHKVQRNEKESLP